MRDPVGNTNWGTFLRSMFLPNLCDPSFDNHTHLKTFSLIHYQTRDDFMNFTTVHGSIVKFIFLVSYIFKRAYVFSLLTTFSRKYLGSLWCCRSIQGYYLCKIFYFYQNLAKSLKKYALHAIKC